jgi:alkylation response protein AidB-like acyl-CoA dehydrogenase
LLAVAAVYDGEEPRLNPNGTPVSRIIFVPAAECRIIDTWHVTGLRGSGSHDYEVDDVFVPEARSLARTASPQPPRHPGPLYTFGFGVVPGRISASPGVPPWAIFGPIGFAAVSLGIARGALDAFAELAASKAPRGGKALLRDDPVVQAHVGQAEATLRAARAFVYGAVGEAWESVCQTGDSTTEQQNLMRLASTHTAVVAAQVVETVWKAAGASSIFLSSPLERRFRDVHVAAQNVAVSPEYYGVAGRLFLDVGQ